MRKIPPFNPPEGRDAPDAELPGMSPSSPSDDGPQMEEQLLRYAEDFGALASKYTNLRSDFISASRDRDKAQQTQQAFESLIRTLDNVGFVSTDASGVVTDANAAAAKLLGMETDKLPGCCLADCMDVAGQTALGHRLALLASDEAEGRYEFACGPASGESGLYVRAMRIAQAEPPGFRINWILRLHGERQVGSGVDRDVFLALFSKASHAIMVTDPAGKIISVNSAFCSVTGYDEAEVLGGSPHILRSGRHDQAFYQKLWQAIRDSGEWQGEIWNRRKSGEVYQEWLHITASRNAAGAVSSYVATFYDIDFARKAHERIYHLAHYDALTGLPNRALLHDRLSHAVARSVRESRCFSVLFLDLDGFKEINDTLGHDVGDEILREFAARLSASVRAADTVARLGGDEFVILAEGIDNEEGVGVLARKILAVLRPPVHLAGQSLYMATSIGAACYPAHGEDAGTLLRNADVAMYVCKRAGGTDFQVYREDFNRGRLERLSLAGALRQALQKRQLSLAYQPQVDSVTCRITGVEALLRWKLPEVGDIPPAQFIGIAEDTGLISSIGAWVLEQACMQQVAWQREGLPPLRMAVNVAARQLNDRNFVELVMSVIARTGIEPRRLELEVTESQLMESLGVAVDNLRRLREFGISIAVDDFGTGYSSLGRLRSLPIDRLKIDRSFVIAMGDGGHGDAIPRAILAMAESLDLATVAEGVELEAQRSLLQAWKCGEMQGFLFARPLAAGDIPGLLDGASFVDILQA